MCRKTIGELDCFPHWLRIRTMAIRHLNRYPSSQRIVYLTLQFGDAFMLGRFCLGEVICPLYWNVGNTFSVSTPEEMSKFFDTSLSAPKPFITFGELANHFRISKTLDLWMCLTSFTSWSAVSSVLTDSNRPHELWHDMLRNMSLEVSSRWLCSSRAEHVAPKVIIVISLLFPLKTLKFFHSNSTSFSVELIK